MAKQRLRNPEIHGPRGAKLVLDNIDFERFMENDLQVAVVLYCSRRKLGDSSTAIYDGSIHVKPERFPEIGDIALPQPRYEVFVPKDELEKEVRKGKIVPAYTLFAHPDNLEFTVHATDEDGYRGIMAFRDILLPGLFKGGYDKHNSSHTSEFWLYAGREDPIGGSSYVLCVSPPDGLSIAKTEVDGIKVFTQMDVDRLMGLKRADYE